MIYGIIITAIVIFIAWKISRSRNSRSDGGTDFHLHIESLKSRASQLGESEKAELIGEVRRLADAGYERVSSEANRMGKPANFQHQAGVLDAAYCVLANTDEMRSNDMIRSALQMETVPFNLLTEDMGKAGIREYLVWKIFPSNAEMSDLEPAIDQFVRKVFDDAEGMADSDDFVYSMIYSGKYDWQDLAIIAAKRHTRDV